MLLDIFDDGLLVLSENFYERCSALVDFVHKIAAGIQILTCELTWDAEAILSFPKDFKRIVWRYLGIVGVGALQDALALWVPW